MTYHSDGHSALKEAPFKDQSLRLCCGNVVTGPTVRYDGYIKANELTSLFMHRDCAFAMAQRMICDAWPNRREKNLMQNDC